MDNLDKLVQLTEELGLYTEKCPVCQVEITNDDKVLFSYGKAGTRSRLYARVCQYAKKEGCINKGDHTINPGDAYTPIETADYTDFIKETLNDI